MLQSFKERCDKKDTKKKKKKKYSVHISLLYGLAYKFLRMLKTLYDFLKRVYFDLSTFFLEKEYLLHIPTHVCPAKYGN